MHRPRHSLIGMCDHERVSVRASLMMIDVLLQALSRARALSLYPCTLCREEQDISPSDIVQNPRNFTEIRFVVGTDMILPQNPPLSPDTLAALL